MREESAGRKNYTGLSKNNQNTTVVSGRNCDSSTLSNKFINSKPQGLQDFSKLVLNNILTQFIELDKDEKQVIFRNIQELDFTKSQYLGGIEIVNKDSCVNVLEKDGVKLMVSANFQKGRALAIAHEEIFTSFLVRDKNWIILLRNIIRLLTKNKPSSNEKPIKILMTTASPETNISKALKRASLFVQMHYEENPSRVNLSDFDCIFMHEGSNKVFTNDVCKKMVDYVSGGGGLLIGFRGWIYKSYGQGKDQKNWEAECCYNKIVSPMGMKFTENSATVQTLKFKPKEIIQLTEQDIRPYTKQLNPLFTQTYDSKQLSSMSETKMTLLEGVGDCYFEDICFSSFVFPEKSYVSLFKENQNSFGSFGTYGKGKVLLFGHPAIFQTHFVQHNSNKRFVQNAIRYMTKNTKNKISVGLLYESGDWGNYGWQSLGMNINSKFIEKAEDFQNQNIICVSYYSHFPKALTPQIIQKLKLYVSNGGNLIFGSHGWVWEAYGEYSQNKSLKYEKNFASSLILKEFGITLNKDCFGTAAPFHTLGLKDMKNRLLEGVGSCTFEGALSSFGFSQQSSISLLKQHENTFCAIANYGKGKIFLYGHPGIFAKSFTEQSPRKKFLQNTIRWMVGLKDNISVGYLFQSGDWYDSGLQHLGLSISSKIIQKSEEFNASDIVCVSYYSHYPESLTPQMIEELKQYVSNGGNLFFASHGWVWENYGEYAENNSLNYEKNFASYVILRSFDLILNRDAFQVTNPYDTSANINQKDTAVENFLKNELLNVLKNKDKNSFNNEDEANRILTKINAVDQSEFELIGSFDLYHEIVDAFIKSRFNVETNYDKLSYKDKFICKVFSFMNALSYAVPPHICRALPPSLNKYPGCATKRINQKTVEVHRNRNKLVFTGLYLNPGQVIRVRHKHNFSQIAGVQLKVNLNSDLTNWDNGNLKRFTHIARTYKIKSGQFLIASPHGGIIYFEVEQDSSQTNPLLFTFQGAYEGIYWNENFHSYADFQKIKKIDAPIFIIETKRMNLIGPTKGLLGQLNVPIQRLCKFWNKVIGIYKDYRGIEQYPFQKDSYFNDVNIMLGYMHSGNPVMTHDDLTFEMIGIGEKLFTNATWGFYHELGHNHQDGKWTVNETVQVTCNIYSLLLINKMHGITIEENMYKERKLEQIVNKYFEKPTMATYGEDPFLGLVLYAIIMEDFGYQVFSQVHKAYNNINLPNDKYQTKFDTLVEQVSIATNHNLWYYFRNWGMPVTNASLNKVKGFKKYVCKRFPFMTKE